MPANSSVALSEFLRHPGTVGSAFQASDRLVRRMLAPLDWSALDVLVEYGPGTGRFTFSALAKMKRESVLIAIETGEEFVDHLRAANSDERLRVVHGSAADVVQILRDHNLAHADCILSGLPFSTLEHEEAEQIIRTSRLALGPSGTFAAYQMRMVIEPLLTRTFGRILKGFEWWNIPPCHLYWASEWSAAEQPAVAKRNDNAARQESAYRPYE